MEGCDRLLCMKACWDLDSREDMTQISDVENISAGQADWLRAARLPVRLQRGAEEVLRLRHWGSGAESQLSLVCVLVLRLTLQWRIDGDGNLLHCCWLLKTRS